MDRKTEVELKKIDADLQKSADLVKREAIRLETEQEKSRAKSQENVQKAHLSIETDMKKLSNREAGKQGKAVQTEAHVAHMRNQNGGFLQQTGQFALG